MPADGPEPPAALEHTVALPLGRARVRLDRSGLALGARGGFEARWDPVEGEALTVEAYRIVVRDHLAAAYRALEGRSPSKVTLNLASHQLVDDLLGWSRLNAGTGTR